MRRQNCTTSYSMPSALHAALSRRLPRFGDRSKLVRHLIEMWLRGEIQVKVEEIGLRSLNVAANNTNWQQP